MSGPSPTMNTPLLHECTPRHVCSRWKVLAALLSLNDASLKLADETWIFPVFVGLFVRSFVLGPWRQTPKKFVGRIFAGNFFSCAVVAPARSSQNGSKSVRNNPKTIRKQSETVRNWSERIQKRSKRSENDSKRSETIQNCSKTIWNDSKWSETVSRRRKSHFSRQYSLSQVFQRPC